MPSLSLTRRVEFSARHRYHRPEWSDARNEAAFGPLALRTLHEHRYTCDVTVKGTVDADTGMIADLRALDTLLALHVVRPLDGTTLNDDVPEFSALGLMPTCENLALIVAQRLDASLREQSATFGLQRVTVAEDPTLSATWERTAG